MLDRKVLLMVLLVFFAGCGTLSNRATIGRDDMQHQDRKDVQQSTGADTSKEKKNEK